MARIHAMEVPIKKTGNWLFETYDNFYQTASKLFDLDQLYKDANCQTLMEHDLPQEIDWLKKAVLAVDSPITFTHIDFRGSNIMVTEPDDEIILCDLEYSCYGFRGFDFGSLFYEWGKEFLEWFKHFDFPTDQQITPFIDSYIEESVKQRGKEFSEDPRNSVQHILKETKVFALCNLMFFVLMNLRQDSSIIDDIPFDKLATTVSLDSHFGYSLKYSKQNFLSSTDLG